MPAQTRGVGLRPRERKAKASVKREGQDDFWIAIGGAWRHQDGDGYNVILQALPKAIRDENDRRKGARREK
jgi:hypothetical protein